jgi:hypothetical protein
VDLKRPENNGGFFIFDLGQTVLGEDPDDPQKGLLFYYAYDIYVPVDIRHVLDDLNTMPFKARVRADNEILVTLPAWDWNLLRNRDALAAKLKDHEIGGIDDAHYKYKTGEYGEMETRKWANHVLQFPKDHVLKSSPIYKDAGPDEVLEIKLVDIEYKDSRLGSAAITDYYAKWTVVCVHKKSRKKGKSDTVAEMSDAAKHLQKIGKLNLGGGSNNDMNTG